MGYQSRSNARERMRSYLQRVATGPELSKDLTADETADALRAILAGSVDPVAAGVFLIAMRMKRETLDENLGALRALRDTAAWATADVEDLVDVAEPYDGCMRHLPVSAFLPAVLAACGLPAVSHGARALGPKYGVTAHQVLRAAGARVDLVPGQAARKIESQDVSWAYVDVEQFHPGLAALTPLRHEIVKRPMLATLDKLCGPLRASGRNHLVVGFVHTGYERLLVDIAAGAGYDSTLVVRGVEGGVVPPLDGPVKGTRVGVGATAAPIALEPAALDLVGGLRAPPIPSDLKQEGARTADRLADRAARDGLRALDGASGPARDALIAAASLVLVHVRQSAPDDAARQVRAALDGGAARRHFEAGA